MTEISPDYGRIAELMALPLESFVEATKSVKPMPCIPSFEPEAILQVEPRLSTVPVREVRSWLEKEYLDARRIFNGWLRLAAVQAANELQDRGWRVDRPNQ